MSTVEYEDKIVAACFRTDEFGKYYIYPPENERYNPCRKRRCKIYKRLRADGYNKYGTTTDTSGNTVIVDLYPVDDETIQQLKQKTYIFNQNSIPQRRDDTNCNRDIVDSREDTVIDEKDNSNNAAVDTGNADTSSTTDDSTTTATTDGIDVGISTAAANSNNEESKDISVNFDDSGGNFYLDDEICGEVCGDSKQSEIKPSTHVVGDILKVIPPSSKLLSICNIKEEQYLHSYLDRSLPPNYKSRSELPDIVKAQSRLSLISRRDGNRPEDFNNTKSDVTVKSHSNRDKILNSFIVFNQRQKNITKTLDYKVIEEQINTFPEPIYCNGEVVDIFDGIQLCEDKKTKCRFYNDKNGVLPFAEQNDRLRYYYLVRDLLTKKEVDEIVEAAVKYSKDGDLIPVMTLFLCRVKAKDKYMKSIREKENKEDNEAANDTNVITAVDNVHKYYDRLLPLVVDEIIQHKLEYNDLDRLTWAQNILTNTDGDRYFDNNALVIRKKMVDIVINSIPKEKRDDPVEQEKYINDNKVLQSIRYMLNSQISEDTKTKKEYEHLNTLLPTNDCVMRLFRNHTFYDIYKVISTQVIPDGSGMESQHAETFLSFVLCDIICPVRDERLTMHYQVRHKKMVIALQEFLKDECMGAGEDVHFSNQVGSFAPIWTYYMKRTDDENKTLDQAKQVPSFRKKFVLHMSRNINKKIGRWANEISGTLKQLLNGSGKKKEAGLAICRQLVKACPGKYDSLVDSSNLVGIEGWSVMQHRQHGEDGVVQSKDFSRKCKADYIPPPTPIKKNKKRKKRPEPPQPPYELSEYELLRLERIKRNEERIRNLGLNKIWCS